MNFEKTRRFQTTDPLWVDVYLQPEDSEWYQKACSHQSCQSGASASFWPLSWPSWTGCPLHSHTIFKLVNCKNTEYQMAPFHRCEHSEVRYNIFCLPVGLIHIYFGFGAEHRIHIILSICWQVWSISVWGHNSPLHGRNLNIGLKLKHDLLPTATS